MIKIDILILFMKIILMFKIEMMWIEMDVVLILEN